LSFWQACVFQWLNPKAWILVLGGLATYAAPERFWLTVAAFAAAFVLAAWPSLAIWAGFGAVLRQVLNTPARVRGFNVAMAGLLLASLWPIVADALGGSR
jgi:threonine/homoserine/homoserine lactone efflux protein